MYQLRGIGSKNPTICIIIAQYLKKEEEKPKKGKKNKNSWECI